MFRHHLANNGHGRVGEFIHAEENFVFRVVLLAEAGEIFVRGKIHATDWLQETHGRSKIGKRSSAFSLEESPGSDGRHEVVAQRGEGKEQDRQSPDGDVDCHSPGTSLRPRSLLTRSPSST